MRNLLAAAVLCATAALGAARESPPENARAIDERLRRQEGFRGQVLLERDGQVLLHAAYGEADAATGRPADLDTLYYIGSIAKQFTSAVAIQLDAEGRLDLDAPLGGLMGGVPPDKAGITMRQLLSHTAGLPANHPDPMARLSREAFLAWVWSAPLERDPGAGFAYSNVGYCLAAAIIEGVEKRPFSDVIRERVLTPAGMVQTWFVDDDVPADRLAIGSGPLCEQFRLGGSPLEYRGSWLRMGCGGMVSTAGDLLKWEGAIRDQLVLSDEQYAAATKPTAEGYGLGWRLSSSRRGTRLHGHDGQFPGFGSAYVRLPEERVTIIILCNAEGLYRAEMGRILGEFFAGE